MSPIEQPLRPGGPRAIAGGQEPGGRAIGRPPAVAWVHAASVGDVRASEPLVGALRARWPGLHLVLTVGRAAGRGLAERLFAGDAAVEVRPPPWPLPPAPGAFLRRHRPDVLVLEYLELWPAWVAACERAGVPVVVVDGHVTRRSLRVRGLLAPAARRLTAFCAQTPADAENARRLGVPPERIYVTGNGKHDRPSVPPAPSAELARLGRFDLGVGSLNPAEEGPALAAFAGLPLRVLWAPRYVERASAMLRLAARLGVPAARRTDATAAAEARWVVLDTVGELAAAWGLCGAAVAGGTFCRREGQNLVEAAAHGLPVVHGPRVENVRAEVEALDGRGAFPVVDWSEAARVVAALAAPGVLPSEPGAADVPIRDPRAALETLRGAVDRQLRVLSGLLRPLDLDGAPNRW